MNQAQVTAELIEAQSTVTVSASPAAGGQLLAVASGAYDVTVRLPQLPIRAKWRVGTSGDWNDLEGGEGFTVAGADSARVYLAKGAAQSASASVSVTVRKAGGFSTGAAQAGLVTTSLRGLVQASLVGDSHSQEGGPTKSGNATSLYDVGWFNWLNMFSGQSFNIVANYGIVGKRTDEIAAEIPACLADASKYAFVTGGANDRAQGVAVATAIAHQESNYRALLAGGKDLVIVTLFPLGAGTAAEGAWTAKFRAWQIRFAQTVPNCHLLDAYSVLINSASAVGVAKANYLRSDNLHPSPKGARAIGQLGATKLAGIYAAASPYHVTSEIERAANDATAVQKLSNPLLSGTVTAGVAASMQITTTSGTPTVTPTVAARADGFGNDQVDTITASGGIAERQIRTNDTVYNRVVNGGTYVPEVYLTVSGQSGIKRIQLRVALVVGGVAYTTTCFASAGESSAQWDQADYEGWVKCPPLTLPDTGAITGGNVNVETYFDGAGAAVVKVGRLSMTPLALQ